MWNESQKVDCWSIKTPPLSLGPLFPSLRQLVMSRWDRSGALSDWNRSAVFIAGHSFWNCCFFVDMVENLSQRRGNVIRCVAGLCHKDMPAAVGIWSATPAAKLCFFHYIHKYMYFENLPTICVGESSDRFDPPTDTNQYMFHKSSYKYLLSREFDSESLCLILTHSSVLPFSALFWAVCRQTAATVCPSGSLTCQTF